jgi:acetyltransferase-like isoleucine patch superfamily enzyme
MKPRANPPSDRAVGKQNAATVFLRAWKIAGILLGFIIPTLKAKIVLRAHECSFGRRLRVCGPVYFRCAAVGQIQLGHDVALTARFLTNTVGITNPIVLECIREGRISIGDSSGLTSSILSARTEIRIGDFVKIGGNVRIFDHDFHSTDYQARRVGRTDFQSVKSSPVIIEDDVFVGTNCVILKGTHIGARSVIAAGSVIVGGHIPADSLVGGNPARVLRTNSNRIDGG